MPGPNGQSVPTVAGVQPTIPDVHRVRTEELHIHLTTIHGCAVASAIAQQLMQDRMQAAARFAPVRPDGTVAVSVDFGEVLATPVHRRRFEELHEAHHDDGEPAHGPAFLHRFAANNVNTGHRHHTREDPDWMRESTDDEA